MSRRDIRIEYVLVEEVAELAHAPYAGQRVAGRALVLEREVHSAAQLRERVQEAMAR